MLMGLYGAAGRLAAPGLRLMVARRLKAGKEVRGRLGERYGIASLPRPTGRLVWLHAASVGETLSVLPVIAALAGHAQVLLTTGTVTSAQLAAERLPAHARHQFVPLDVPGWVARFLNHWKPDCAVFVESELWPGLLGAIDARGIPRLLINARMSAASTKRWNYLPAAARRLLAGFRIIHAQSDADARNLAALGMTDVQAWGNLKLCGPVLPADDTALAALRALAPAPLWLAASTHPGEEEIVIAAHRLLLAHLPNLLTIIVPRHPARGVAVAALADGLKVALRSKSAAPAAGGVYVADTLGELGLFYRLAPFAFVGNSLVGFGGHNPIEPARLGRAVIAGPHLENFAEAAAALRAAGALREVTDAASLAAAVQAWLADPAGAAAAGAAAAAAFAGMDDLPGRIATLILETAL
jgi:3-deoxy-D-manno-octulosonic-acid transferase